MKVTGDKTRSVFDRYDITSEEDLAEAARKLRSLTMGTISGTTAVEQADALQDGIAKSLKLKKLMVARDRIELLTLRFSARGQRLTT